MPSHIADMICAIYPATRTTVPETITNKSQTGVFGLAQMAQANDQSRKRSREPGHKYRHSPADAAAALFDTVVRLIRQGLRTLLVRGWGQPSFLTGS